MRASPPSCSTARGSRDGPIMPLWQPHILTLSWIQLRLPLPMTHGPSLWTRRPFGVRLLRPTSLTQVRPLLHPRDPAGYHRAWATVCSNRTHTPRTGSPPGPVRAPPPPADAFGNTIGPVVRWGPPSPWGACRWLSFAPDIRRSDLLPESFPMPNTSSPRSPAQPPFSRPWHPHPPFDLHDFTRGRGKTPVCIASGFLNR